MATTINTPNIQSIAAELLTSIEDKIQFLVYSHPLKEIKYFHPKGNSLPNGSHYQKGNFIRECNMNKESFSFPEGFNNDENIQDEAKGGIMVFSIESKDILRTLNYNFSKAGEMKVNSYYIGNFFKGSYISETGDRFNKNSLCIFLPRLSHRDLIELAQYIHNNSTPLSILLKDLKDNKIYTLKGWRTQVKNETEITPKKQLN